jgi:pyruvate dehydrogenase E1 component beta subunit
MTLITYGSALPPSMRAVDQLREEYRIELLDLRTLSPLDEDAIVSSAIKTGRVVIAHEAPRTLGLAAEVSALIAENAIEYMEAPIIRVTGFDVPMPLARSEDFFLINEQRIVDGIRRVMSF